MLDQAAQEGAFASSPSAAARASILPLLSRLVSGSCVSASDCNRLADTILQFDRTIPAHVDLFTEGDELLNVKIILSGWAIRYRSLPSGHRQILSFLLPGDACASHGAILRRMDHSIASLTPVRYADIPQASFDRLVEGAPTIEKAFRKAELVTLSMQREATLSLGQRSAIARVAHLLSETLYRLQSRGLGGPENLEFPPTQTEIAEATGLTAVHVNRMVQQLRRNGLITLRGKELAIIDVSGLWKIALFDPAYLHDGEDYPPVR